jgi:hypothetical protein
VAVEVAAMRETALTNRDLLLASGALRSIGPKTIKNIRAAFAIAVLKRVANDALQDLEAARVALCEQHAAKDGEGGKPVKLPDGTYDIPDRAAFEAEFNKLLDIKITLACAPILLAHLDGSEGFTADELFQLGPLVITDEPAVSAS